MNGRSAWVIKHLIKRGALAFFRVWPILFIEVTWMFCLFGFAVLSMLGGVIVFFFYLRDTRILPSFYVLKEKLFLVFQKFAFIVPVNFILFLLLVWVGIWIVAGCRYSQAQSLQNGESFKWKIFVEGAKKYWVPMILLTFYLSFFWIFYLIWLIILTLFLWPVILEFLMNYPLYSSAGENFWKLLSTLYLDLRWWISLSGVIVVLLAFVIKFISRFSIQVLIIEQCSAKQALRRAFEFIFKNLRSLLKLEASWVLLMPVGMGLVYLFEKILCGDVLGRFLLIFVFFIPNFLFRQIIHLTRIGSEMAWYLEHCQNEIKY